MTFFSFFGIEPKLALDPVSLQKRFYELSRQWHPDRFATKGAEAQRTALENTALLNDAFRVLKDPVQRAEYVLEAEGLKANAQPPAELLEEVLELNMAIEELKDGDASVRPQLEHALGQFTAMLDSIDAQLGTLFAEWDSTANRKTLEQVRAALNRRKYIDNLVNTVKQALAQ